MKIHALIVLSVLLVAVSMFSGCGPDGPKRYPISGTVTFEGIPVVDGLVIFTPNSRKGTAGPQGCAVIVNGKYKADRAQGVMQGAYFATLSGYSEPHHGGEGDPRKPIFRDVNVEFEVTEKSTTVDFPLTKDDLKK